MKIKVEKGKSKPFLNDGRHEVEITAIAEGKSEHKEIPFFACRFENTDGYVISRFYLSDPGLAGIVSLFESVGLKIKEGEEINTDALLHKKVSILVQERTYNDPETGNERTIKQASDFQKVGQRA
ncbi:MAG: hypothetical protein V4714_18620 [Bacteroidota bacterium]